MIKKFYNSEKNFNNLTRNTNDLRILVNSLTNYSNKTFINFKQFLTKQSIKTLSFFEILIQLLFILTQVTQGLDDKYVYC